jgi:hypothetical protein
VLGQPAVVLFDVFSDSAMRQQQQQQQQQEQCSLQNIKQKQMQLESILQQLC